MGKLCLFEKKIHKKRNVFSTKKDENNRFIIDFKCFLIVVCGLLYILQIVMKQKNRWLTDVLFSISVTNKVKISLLFR